MRERIESYLPEAIFLEPAEFDEAIIGIAERAGGLLAVAYDRARCIDVLVAGGMEREDAEEWFEFNTVAAYVGEQTPVFIDSRWTE